MNVTIIVNIVRTGQSASATKFSDIPFTPSIGLTIEHPTWHDPRKVINVSWNLESKVCVVLLENELPDSAEEFDACVKMYKSHEWSLNIH